MRARPVLLLAALLLAPAYLVSPPSAPPLYDGLGFPDEPYRALGTTTTAPPTSAFAAGSVLRDGSGPPLNAATAETGPQAAVAVPQGALLPPPDAGTVSVRVEPVPVPVPAPRVGRTLSNAYAFTLSTRTGQLVPVRADRPVVVQLRIPTATQEQVVLQVQDGRRWRDLPTRQTGVDVYGADLDRSGTVVAVARQARVAGPSSTDPAQRSSPLVLVGGGAALLAAVLAVRTRRARPA